MGAFPDARVNAGVDARLVTPHLSAHTAFSATGANEVTGGSPAYARAVMAMDASASRISDNTAAEELDIPASTTVEYVGVWDHVTTALEANFITMMPLGSTKTLVGMATPAASGVEVADTFWVPAHGLANDDRVAFFAVDGSLPTGVDEGTLYWVIGTPTTNTFQVSTTQDGGALDVTAAGSFIMSDAVPETFASQGKLSLGAGDLDVVGLG